jgi:hypothetical protein
MLGYDPVRVAVRLWIDPQGHVRTLAERAAPRPEALIERMQHHHPRLRLIEDDAGARAGAIDGELRPPRGALPSP